MDSLLGAAGAAPLLERWGREAVKDALRGAIASGAADPSAILAAGEHALRDRFSPTLRRAVNATGVLLHTNLGRSPLSEAARDAVASAATGYSTLEYDPATGDRGRRQDHVRAAACALFACEDALAVNNNAAAVFLALSALAAGRRVLISRGELVAIGGSFQIPAILEASGAKLAEVGTTNRTTIDDYRRALEPEVSLLLTVHPSNYEIRGFTARPDPADLAALAREARIPWLHDQGTGCVVDLAQFGVAGEPTVSDCLESGADLVTFSGDKLLGGPQAGLVVGRRETVAVLARHPVARVVRPDKLTLAALAATLSAWQTGAWRRMPVYAAAAASADELERRGEAIRARLHGDRLDVEIVEALALFGGGTSPEKRFDSRALAVARTGTSADSLAKELRENEVPIVGRVEAGRLLLDLRSIAPEEDLIVAAALERLGGPPA